MRKVSRGCRRVLRVDVAALVLSVFAVVVSVAAVVVSARGTHRGNEIAEKANFIAEQARRAAEDSLSLAAEANRIASEELAADRQSFVPVLERWYYVAVSLDFQESADSTNWSVLGLAPRPVKTRFWHAEYGQYQPGSEKRYLFIVIGNRGGAAHDMELSDMRWFAKRGFQEPEGWSEIAELGVLERGQAYALLVDTMESYDVLEDVMERLKRARCDDVWLTLGHSDAFGNEYPAELVKLSELAQPMRIEPGY